MAITKIYPEKMNAAIAEAVTTFVQPLVLMCKDVVQPDCHLEF